MLCSLFQFLFPLFILYYPFVFTFAEIYAIKKNSKSKPLLLPFSSSQRQFSLLSFYPRFTFAITIVSYIREHCAIGFVLIFYLNCSFCHFRTTSYSTFRHFFRFDFRILVCISSHSESFRNTIYRTLQLKHLSSDIHCTPSSAFAAAASTVSTGTSRTSASCMKMMVHKFRST